MLTAENEMDCCLKSPNQIGEHSDSSNVCVCVPLSIRFVFRHHPAVVSTLLEVILRYNEE